jgi:serine O-acetyltransferase
MITLLPDHLQTLFNDLRRDIDRYVVMDNASWLLIFLTKPGLWVLTQYRCSRWVDQQVHLPMIRFILKVLCAIWQKLIEIITCSEFPNKANIAPGVFIPHSFGIIIHHEVTIGENCNLAQDVTIGIGGRGENRGCPKIGDRVFIGAGARIFGPITIGNDVAIGANAVVTKDLPDQAVAVGIPAKIISYEGSQDFVILGAKNEIKKEISLEN